MLTEMKSPRCDFEARINFMTPRRRKVQSDKIFTLKEIAICSSLIFACGLTLGIAIMQAFTT